MMLLPEILIVCLGVFLYIVFAYAHDDFILLRKNISLEHLFNITLIGFLVSLLSSRLFFVVEHFKPLYVQPLAFLLFPYFPGLSLIGGVIGGYLYVLYGTYRKKMPLSRVSDVFALALLMSISIGMVAFFLTDLLFTKKLMWGFLIGGGVFMVVGFLLGAIFNHGKIRDGSTALLAGAALCLIELGGRVPHNIKKISFSAEDILFLIFFFMSIILYFQQKYFSPKIGKK